MRIEDRLQDTEIKIIKTLYDHRNKSDKVITFDADSYDLTDIIKESGISKNNAMSALKNLKDFDFIEWDKGRVKLLPSGIKYSKGQFDGQIH